MYQELGITPSALAVARHYHSIINGFVMDQIDRDQAEQVSRLGMQVLVVDTIMKTIEDRHRLAQDVLHFCGKLNGR
jgi:LPPG:FO 2-phospho-L-lactate transferase